MSKLCGPGLPDQKNPQDKLCPECGHLHFIPGDNKTCTGCGKEGYRYREAADSVGG